MRRTEKPDALGEEGTPLRADGLLKMGAGGLVRADMQNDGGMICQRSRPSCVAAGWQGQRDSNPRHSVLETDALPTELYP